MAGYIGSKSSVTLVDGYSEAEADAEFVAKSTTGNLTLDVSGDIILDADGGDVVISDAGTEIAHLSNSNSDFKIESKVSDKDMIFRGNDGGSGVTALTLDMSDAGSAIFNNKIKVGNTTLTGASLSENGDFTFDMGGDIILDADGGDIRFSDGGTQFGKFTNSSGDFVISSSVNDKDIIFKGADGGSDITAIKIDMSAGGAVNMPIQPAFLAQGDGQTGFPLSTATTIDFETEVFDQGANFSSNTFTAPVTGRYLFACMVYARNLDIGTNYYQLQLVTSNRTITAGLGTSGYNADMLYFPFSISLLVDMDFDDTAVLKMDVGSGGANQLIVESQTYFSGYLVA